MYKKHLTGTVPVNKKHLTGTLFVHYTDEFDPGFVFFGQKNDRSRCLFFSSGGITLTRVIVNDSCLRYLPSVLEAM